MLVPLFGANCSVVKHTSKPDGQVPVSALVLPTTVHGPLVTPAIANGSRDTNAATVARQPEDSFMLQKLKMSKK